jgi:hypothetical protein
VATHSITIKSEAAKTTNGNIRATRRKNHAFFAGNSENLRDLFIPYDSKPRYVIREFQGRGTEVCTSHFSNGLSNLSSIGNIAGYS